MRVVVFRRSCLLYVLFCWFERSKDGPFPHKKICAGTGLADELFFFLKKNSFFFVPPAGRTARRSYFDFWEKDVPKKASRSTKESAIAGHVGHGGARRKR
jgi:hypothetical protein